MAGMTDARVHNRSQWGESRAEVLHMSVAQGEK